MIRARENLNDREGQTEYNYSSHIVDTSALDIHIIIAYKGPIFLVKTELYLSTSIQSVCTSLLFKFSLFRAAELISEGSILSI